MLIKIRIGQDQKDLRTDQQQTNQSSLKLQAWRMAQQGLNSPLIIREKRGHFAKRILQSPPQSLCWLTRTQQRFPALFAGAPKLTLILILDISFINAQGIRLKSIDRRRREPHTQARPHQTQILLQGLRYGHRRIKDAQPCSLRIAT